MSSIEQVKKILDSTLELGGRVRAFGRETPLLGDIPELDSMAVVNLMTTMEEQFDIVVEDDEVSAETFATLGDLVDFVDFKLAAA
ncbi:acyl carrier protein [Thioalkalivibrio sp. AKL17]|uniref:acyl carrier protein n=1 Tax=Thioalkalivibrio sp. AKL17 TaxID=1158160 RepID=UPI00037858D3|nr:acyl carrier protein [Thioalkalivibrio sp. AKL17]